MKTGYILNVATSDFLYHSWKQLVAADLSKPKQWVQLDETTQSHIPHMHYRLSVRLRSEEYSHLSK